MKPGSQTKTEYVVSADMVRKTIRWTILYFRVYFAYSLPIILLLIVVAAGWFTTDYLGNKARQEIIGESQASALTLSIYVSSTFASIEGAVKSLAGSPWIAPALMSKKDQDIEHANSTLDRYNAALNGSVSYLMDVSGMTVASSNRNDPDSFVGNSYHFRPYFQEAAKGKPGRYFALGITSGKRGFYASHPVQNLPGKVVGVVTMKKDLDDMETFFSKYPFCFFINPDGIIFLSSAPAMVLKSLWPMDKSTQEKLIASHQFGNKSFEAVMEKEIVDGTEVTLEGNDYFVSRKLIDSNGWSILLLTPIDHIRNYKLIGILATISVCFMTLILSGIIYTTDRSKEAIRQSEESKRLLLHAAGEGIFGVDAMGQVTFVNPAALSTLGFSEEDMLGQSVHDLIHHSNKDGSNYPVEDCPMYASYTKAAHRNVTNEVLWRKDGSNFPVEYSSTPITENGKIMGAVVTFKDITDRKQAEEALRESESRMRAITDSAQDAILMMDPDGRISYWNPAAERILGYTNAEAIGQKLHPLIVPPHYHEAHHAAFPLFQQKGQGAAVGKTLDLEARRKDGKEISVQLSLSAVHMKGAWHAVGVLRDITEYKQAEEALKKREAQLNEMGRIAKVGGWEFDTESQKQVWTKEVYHIHEVEESYEPTVSKGIEFYVPASRPIIEKAVQRAIEYGEPFDVELEIVTAKGNHRWVQVNGKVDRERGISKIISGTFQDITERRQAEEKIRQMAYHDSLTGLPNRMLLIDRLTMAISQADRNRNKVAFMMLDLDKFKEVNDTLGHHIGDLLLKSVADKLTRILRQVDTVARFGGDEFVLVLPEQKDAQTALRVARKIMDAFRDTVVLDGHSLTITSSIGISLYPDHGADIDAILKNADSAMYNAKQAGRNRYQLYNEA